VHGPARGGTRWAECRSQPKAGGGGGRGRMIGGLEVLGVRVVDARARTRERVRACLGRMGGRPSREGAWAASPFLLI
jgi:hypothetical protein